MIAIPTPMHRSMSAEWAPHQATWLSWPHNESTWPGLLAAAESAMIEVVAQLALVEQVHINVQDEAHAQHVQRCLAGRVPAEQVSLQRLPTDDAWIRDYGAIIVHGASDHCGDGPEDGLLAVDFAYNAWGGKYLPFDRDCAVAGKMANCLDFPLITNAMVLEGGSIDVNGLGLGLVTERCLLNPNRNPTMDRVAIETALSDCLGLTELVWLDSGIAGDDTDGHVDNLSRFVAEESVVTVVERDRSDPNFRPLAENRRRLETFEDAQGHGLAVITLPMPEAQLHLGVRLPASYANFYIANELVLVPGYACAEDDQARSVLADCFPGRRIQLIDCRALVVGLGALHCLTQQIPAIVAAAAIE